MDMGDRSRSFLSRLKSGDTLIGTFIKTPSPIVAEVLGLADLDVIALDTEHAPFGRMEQDLCIAALRAADMPALVRVADDSSTQIRNALDSGATGVVVPHVTSADQAAKVVAAAHFGEGGRGFSGSTRAAAYGKISMKGHIADDRAQTVVIVQIEDVSALEHVAQIAAVDGVDCLFVGRADLAVAMDKGINDKDVIATVKDICAAAQSAGIGVGMYTPNLDELPGWRDAGASLFLLSSDQAMLLAGANSLASHR